MIDEAAFRRIKRKAENAKREYDRAVGGLQGLMDQLKSDFGCSTLEAGEAKLKELQRDIKKMAAKYDKAVNAFDEKWGEVSDGSE